MIAIDRLYSMIGGGDDGAMEAEEEKEEALKKQKNAQLMLQRVSAIRRLRSGGSSDSGAGSKQTLG